MAPRFSRPRLIDASDRLYREHLARIMMTKDNHRPMRPPRARELFGGESEEALRQWLGERYTLSDRRLIEYLEHKGRSAVKKYRELDAVIIEGSSVQIFEMKASEKASSVRRAARQLRDSRELLQMIFRNVTCTILLVDTGIPKSAEDVAAIMAQEDAPFEPPPTLDEVLALLPEVRQAATLDERDPAAVNLMRFDVAHIIGIAGEENLHLVWDEDDDDLIEDEEGAEEPAAEDAPADDAADADAADAAGGAFAEAMRKAMESKTKRR